MNRGQVYALFFERPLTRMGSPRADITIQNYAFFGTDCERWTVGEYAFEGITLFFMAKNFNKRFRYFACSSAHLALLFLLFFIGLMMPVAVNAISVSITDNVMVLDERTRSGQIELLSMTPSPVEFEVTPGDLPDEVKDGRDYLRWAPERTVVPANRSRPLRMVFRPTDDLPAGEYIVRLAVQSREVDYEPDFGAGGERDSEDDEEGLSVGVALQPVLPVTVYIRHNVGPPSLSVGEFTPSPDDADTHGYFTVSKPPEAISYIGTVALVGESSGERYTSGRLRMGNTVDEQRVRVPKLDSDADLDEAICLQLWPEFPARGEPEQAVCQ